MRLLALLFIFLLGACKQSTELSSNNLVRFLTLYDSTSTTPSLSISGSLSQDGTAVSNTLITTSSSTLSTSTSIVSRGTTTSESIRCVDYNLTQGEITCILIINTSYLTGATDGCYSLYYASTDNDKLEKIAKFQSISVGNDIQLAHSEALPTGAQYFKVFSCNGSSESLLASTTITDYTDSSGFFTDSDGNYSTDLATGQNHTLTIKRPTKDLGDISVDLRAVNTTEEIDTLKNDPSSLPITIPNGFTHQVNSLQSKTDGSTTGVATTNTNPNSTANIDINTLSQESTNDTKFTPATSTTTTTSTNTSTAMETPPTLAYTGSPFTFSNTTPVSLVPTITGNITSCTASPSLPNGLSLNQTTCAITGTPSSEQLAKNYTITASNTGGSVNTTINAHVSSANYVLDFDGSDDKAVTNTIIPYNSTAFTVIAWVKTTADGVIFAWGSSTINNFTIVQIHLGKLRLAMGSGSSPVYIDGSTTITTGSWTHIAVTKRADDTVTLYVNGSIDGSGSVSSSNYTVSPSVTSIGVGYTNGTFQQYFIGRLEAVSIWQIDQSAGNISAFQSTPPVGNETGLIAYYKFNSLSGTYGFDFTFNGYDFTLSNFALTGSASNWIPAVHP
ncbi:MAG: LamG-like jellyroll fold domain-containing protein [Spirochaetota bacterium]